MGGELIGLVAVILGMGVPLGALYTYYRVRKLRSEERLAAIARGVDIPMEPELNQAARSRRSGILLVSGALGYIATFGLIAGIQADRDIWTVAAFGPPWFLPRHNGSRRALLIYHQHAGLGVIR
jgi:hypothetical protein